tara:strand:- start:1875 stop:2099 length:225 start_codon:yes stop_codon:yes gene_type:complete
MTDTPKWRASKGRSYLKDLNVGSMFKTSMCKGILISLNNSSASVIITEYYGNKEDSSFYVGKHRIALETEVDPS